MITYKINSIFFDDIEKQDITITIGGDGIDADISNIRLFGASKDLINTIIANGGYFDRISFEVFFSNINIFKGYISFRQSHNLADSCEFIELSVVKEDSKKGLEDISDSLTVLGGIVSGDISTVPIPYQLSGIPDKLAIAIALGGVFITGYILNKEITEIIKDISAATTNPFTVNLAIGLGIQILYTGTVLIALVKYIVDLFNALISPVKNTPTYNLTQAITAMLNKLGYQLQSDFLFSSPVSKFHIVQTIDNDGNVIENSTLRDLLNFCKQLFNADIEVIGNIVNINKKGGFGSGGYVIEDYILISKELDLSECPSSILLRFSYDSSDKNTVTNGVGNLAQALFNRHGDAKVNEIQLARAKRKESLTKPEQILLTLAGIFDSIVNTMITIVNGAVKAINGAISIFNKIIKALKKIGIKININIKPIPLIEKIDIGASIKDRIGNMLVEADTWGVPKLAMVTNYELDENHKKYVNAGWLYSQFYSQRYVYEKWKIRITICFQDLQILKTQKYVILNGETFKVVEATFNLNSTTADLTILKIKQTDIPENKLIIT